MSEDEARNAAVLLAFTVPGIAHVALARFADGDYCCVFRDPTDAKRVITITDAEDYVAYIHYIGRWADEDDSDVLP